jgi:predicted CXXCH cytochrome family protein
VVGATGRDRRAAAVAALVVAASWGGIARAGDDATICVRCHQVAASAAASGAGMGHAPGLDCVSCHEDRRPGEVGRHHRSIPACASHHDEMRHPPRMESRPGRPTRNCLSCHDVHGSPNLHLVRPTLVRRGRVIPVDFTTEVGAGPGGFTDPAAPGTGLCEVCHRDTDFYTANGRGKPHFSEPCTVCHDHAAGFRPVASDANCAICHGDEAARFAKPSRHSARFACSGCHAEVDPTPGRGHRAVPACTDCHQNATHAPAGYAPLPCTQCHDPHGTDNLNLVADVIRTVQGSDRPIRFDNLLGRADGSFASASTPGSGVCEVCHTTTRHYRADGTGDPHFTFSCLPCHLHSTGFEPQ